MPYAKNIKKWCSEQEIVNTLMDINPDVAIVFKEKLDNNEIFNVPINTRVNINRNEMSYLKCPMTIKSRLEYAIASTLKADTDAGLRERIVELELMNRVLYIAFKYIIAVCRNGFTYLNEYTAKKKALSYAFREFGVPTESMAHYANKIINISLTKRIRLTDEHSKRKFKKRSPHKNGNVKKNGKKVSKPRLRN